MGRLPKRTREHVIEEKSHQYVRQILPTEWIIESGQEDYGIDLVAEIVFNEAVTGAHFLIQLKGTDKLIIRNDSYIAHSCKTSTLRYFLERSELVIYLVYDAQAHLGYWIWIQDYLRGLRSGWQNQGSLTVRIPLNNVFDQNALPAITHRVIKAHRQTTWLSATQTAQNPFFRYDFKSSGEEYEVNIYPKYPGAEQDRPVEIKGTFKFDQSPEAQAALQALETAFKTGASVEIDSRFFEGFSLPEAFSDLFAHFDGFQPNKIKIGTAKSDRRFAAKISILDQDDNYIAEVPYIDFKVIQEGTEEITFSNEEQNIPPKVQLKINLKDYTSSLSLRTSFSPGVNILQIRKLLNLKQALVKGCKVEITDLATDISTEASIESNSAYEPNEALVQLVNDLVFIQRKSRQLFLWPENISIDEVHLVNQIATILKSGQALKKVSGIYFEANKPTAQNLAKAYADHGQILLRFDYREDIVQLLKVEVPLGPYTAVIPNAKLKDSTLEEIKGLDNLPDDTIIRIDLTIGEPGIFCYYHRWLPVTDVLEIDTNTESSD